MLLLYNIIQIFLLILLWPLLLIYVLLKPKYRNRIPLKLGKSLKKAASSLAQHKKTIWIHALSVGEVTSAVSLVTHLRHEYTEANIVFSASTQTGSKLAEDLLQPYCDQIIVFPLDFIFVIKYFLNNIQPDLFVLVETDFWPNFLNQLHKRKIPAILVNGRISKKSITSYKKFPFFFKKMFTTFSILGVQTDTDKRRLVDLGVVPKKVRKLGNLKYELPQTFQPPPSSVITDYRGFLLVAGSTHAGEEETLLEAFITLKEKYKIRMVIAPRQIHRGQEIADLSHKKGLKAGRRSLGDSLNSDIYVLDNIGELISFYSLADLSFVGGSLVEEGGHNPIEPAAYGKPVLFGPYMTDFEEISEELKQSGGAFCIKSQDDLTEKIDELLFNKKYRLQCGEAVLSSVRQNAGTLKRHLDAIREIM